jgi:hypothetical protein
MIDAENPGAGRFVCFVIDIIVVGNSANTYDTCVEQPMTISVNIFIATLIIVTHVTFEPSFYYFTTDKTKHNTLNLRFS